MTTAPGGDPDETSGSTGEGLRDSSMRNFFWMSGGGGLSAILKLVVLAVLGRLLTPEDFGLVGAALTIVALAEVFARIGIAPSIIQAPELTPEMVRTAMLATLVAGFIIAGMIYLLADQIAALYAIPELVVYIEVFALLFVIRGAGLVSGALLQRHMQFRILAGIEVLTYLVGYACVAITFAMMGFGAWALVAGQIFQAFLQTVIYLYFKPAALQLGFDFPRFRQMMRFGIGITLSQIANYIAQNADYFIVGRYLGAANLGFYTRAYVLLAQPAQLVGSTADKVLFPAMASIQTEPKRLSRAFSLALKLCALTQIPATVLLIVTAPEIVSVLIGDQWGAVVLPFRILVSALFFRTAYKFVGTLMRASGNIYFNAAWQWFYAAMVISGSSMGLPWGLEGVAVGVSGAVVLCFFTGLAMVRMVLGISAKAGMWAVVRYAVMGAVQMVLLMVLKSWLEAMGMPDLVILLGLSFFCLFAFLGLLLWFPKLFGEEGALLLPVVQKILARLRPGGGSGNRT